MKKEGAGFIVFKDDTVGKDPLILALVQDDGVFDIPKGRQDDGESSLQTAKRECFEECSIMISDDEMFLVDSSPHVNGHLTTFCARTAQVPNITINPHSGILEHADFKWVDREEFCANCLDYLISPVEHFYSAYDRAYND